MKLGRAAILVAIAAASACKKKSPPPPPPAAPAPVTTSVSNEETPAPPRDPFAPDPRALPSVEESPSEVPIGVDTVTSAFVVKGAAPVDPFEAPTAALRARALGCFAPLPSGEYAATITVHVTPAGTVSRVELDPGNVDDGGVLDCLQHTGESASFPASKDGRTLDVEVRVQG